MKTHIIILESCSRSQGDIRIPEFPRTAKGSHKVLMRKTVVAAVALVIATHPERRLSVLAAAHCGIKDTEFPGQD